MSDTIAAIATGAQVAAIGIIRLSGEGAISAVDALFTPAHGAGMSQRGDRQLVYGALRTASGETLDMCLCTVSRAPNTYTGEDTAELQCHGSPMVLRLALNELTKLGVRQARPGEFTQRAFLNGRMDLTGAEAVADLIDAETEEAAKNAALQLGGAISRKTGEIYSQLADISAHYHAVLDYPDEDIEDFRLEHYLGMLNVAKETLSRLRRSYDRGRLMNSGIPTVIAGRPNAGKSSLLNALVGYDRAIVTAVPGTTRDTIEEKLHLNGLCLRLIDTAGIRDTADEVERLGVERSREALTGAALVLAVIDGSCALTLEDEDIIRLAESAERAIVVLSKKDLKECSFVPETTLPVVSLSSVTGEGLEALEERIRSLFPMPDLPSGEILTNARQAQAVERALDYVSAAIEAAQGDMTPDIVLTELEGAMDAIAELEGRSVREDVTARIFERFCVGK